MLRILKTRIRQAIALYVLALILIISSCSLAVRHIGSETDFGPWCYVCSRPAMRTVGGYSVPSVPGDLSLWLCDTCTPPRAKDFTGRVDAYDPNQMVNGALGGEQRMPLSAVPIGILFLLSMASLMFAVERTPKTWRRK